MQCEFCDICCKLIDKNKEMPRYLDTKVCVCDKCFRLWEVENQRTIKGLKASRRSIRKNNLEKLHL